MGLKGKIKARWSSLREKVAAAKQNHRYVRVLLNKYFILTFIFLIWILFLDNNNVMVWLRTQHTLRRQKAHIELLEREINQTETRIDQLSSQRDSLERFAREEYLFHEPGEDVYIVK